MTLQGRPAAEGTTTLRVVAEPGNPGGYMYMGNRRFVNTPKTKFYEGTGRNVIAETWYSSPYARHLY